MDYTVMTPLEILCEALVKCAQEKTARDVLDAYATFLAYLEDEEKRKHLNELTSDNADDDSLFQEMRKTSHKFQMALTRLFYKDHEGLKDLTIKYGVF